MKMKFILITICILLAITIGFAQKHANTLNFNDNTGSPKRSLSDIGWIQGH